MTIDDKVRDEKVQYEIKRKATKISAQSSGKLDEHEYFTGGEILPSDQSRIVEQVKFTYLQVYKFPSYILQCLLGKAFEKQIKVIEYQGIKQVKALKALKQKENQEFFQKKLRNSELKIK